MVQLRWLVLIGTWCTVQCLPAYPERPWACLPRDTQWSWRGRGTMLSPLLIDAGAESNQDEKLIRIHSHRWWLARGRLSDSQSTALYQVYFANPTSSRQYLISAYQRTETALGVSSHCFVYADFLEPLGWRPSSPALHSRPFSSWLHLPGSVILKVFPGTSVPALLPS